MVLLDEVDEIKGSIQRNDISVACEEFVWDNEFAEKISTAF